MKVLIFIGILVVIAVPVIRLEHVGSMVADHPQKQVADEYHWSSTRPEITFEYVRPKVLEFLESLPRGAKVLDLGCGNGVLTASYRERGWELTGADFSESGIALARKEWPDIRWELMDATGSVDSLGIGQYDAVITTEVIEHVFLPTRFAANCARLLKSGGILVVSTPYHGYLKNLAIAITGGVDSHVEALRDYGHIKFWSVPTLSQLLLDAGFDDIRWQGAGRAPRLWKSIVMRAAKVKKR